MEFNKIMWSDLLGLSPPGGLVIFIQYILYVTFNNVFSKTSNTFHIPKDEEKIEF